MGITSAILSLFQAKAKANQPSDEERDLRERIKDAAKAQVAAAGTLSHQLDQLEPFHRVTELFRN